MGINQNSSSFNASNIHNSQEDLLYGQLPPERGNGTFTPPSFVPIKITSVDSSGLVTFAFGARIKVPNFNQTTNISTASRHLEMLNLADFINPTVIDVKMTQGFDPKLAPVNWTAVSLQELFMQIQLLFSNPLEVSSESVDHLQVNFLNKDLFILKSGTSYLLNQQSDLTTSSRLPTQFLSKQAALEA